MIPRGIYGPVKDNIQSTTYSTNNNIRKTGGRDTLRDKRIIVLVI